MAVSRLTQTSLQNAFQKYNSIWDGTTAVGSMEAISSVTLTGNQSVVQFNNIPQTYTHLQIRTIARASAATSWPSPYLQINGDTGNNYSYHYLQGNGTAASAGSGSTTNLIYYPLIPAANQTANLFASSIIDILDYTNTSKYTTLRSLGGVMQNSSSADIEFMSGLWQNTAALTSISFFPSNGTNFVQYSTFSLYGIK